MSGQNKASASALPAPGIKRANVLDGVRQLAYAWVGLWGIAGDDIGNFYLRCVSRGEQLLNAKSSAAQPEGQPLPLDVVASQPPAAASRRIRPVSIVNAFGAVESYHFDLNVDQVLPTKAEFDALLERVEALSREVDALVEQRKQEQ